MELSQVVEAYPMLDKPYSKLNSVLYGKENVCTHELNDLLIVLLDDNFELV